MQHQADTRRKSLFLPKELGMQLVSQITHRAPALLLKTPLESLAQQGRHEAGVEYPTGITGSTAAGTEVRNSTSNIYYRTDSRCRYQVQATILKNCSTAKYYFDHGSSVCKSTCNAEAPFKTGWECSWICRSVINCFIQRPAVPCARRQRTTIYYFDLFKGMCLPQQGCTYRGNNFPTLQECERTCGVYTGTKQEAQVRRQTGYVVPSTIQPSKPLMGVPNGVTEYTGARQPSNAVQIIRGDVSSVRGSTGGTGPAETIGAEVGHSNSVANPAIDNAAGRQHNNTPTESGAGHGISAPYPTGITNTPLENGERVTHSTHTTDSTTSHEPDLRNPVGVPGSTVGNVAEAGHHRGLVGSKEGRRTEHGRSYVASHAPNGNVARVGVSSGATGTTASSLTGKVYPHVMGQSTGSGAPLATYPLGLTDKQILKGAATVQEIFSAIQEFIGALPFNSLRTRNSRRTRRQDDNNDTARHMLRSGNAA
ncbi:uncharacterized protein LOC119465301 isoform X2 [Dermacentor silvarum]|uniref:uncharacterized protein LOC119465301 isoform X2 n=1 Tax=Dermacentor silvarum TaxID=543639 RepID=UPI0021014767|nr:uncharacterized protein LOC119465301 isoform X2 [Dermacentor silvarum]